MKTDDQIGPGAGPGDASPDHFDPENLRFKPADRERIEAAIKAAPRPVTVIAPGSNVMLSGEIPAKVAAVTIRQGFISYQLVWWDGRQRQEEWVNHFEIDSSAAPMLRVGFANGSRVK